MADIKLITIQPPQTVSSVQQSQVPGGTGAHVSIANIPPGTVLSGFIVNRDAAGNPVLRTDSGDITFSSNFFLKIGSEVTIRIAGNPGSTLAQILTVDGQPPEVAENVSGFASSPDVIVSQTLAQTPSNVESAVAASAAPAAEATALPSPSIAITGTLISTPPGQSQPAVPVGTQLSLNVTTLAVPPGEPAATPAAIPTIAAPYAAYARAAGNISPAPVTAATNAPEPTANILSQTAVATPSSATSNVTPVPESVPSAPAESLVIATPAAAAAQTATTTPPVPTPGQAISATVIGNESTGEALVQTPLGIVRLQPGTTLPVGSNVTFEVTSVTPPATASVSTVATPAPLTELAHQWTSLQQIAGLLTSRPTPYGTNSLESIIPWLPAATATALPTAALAQTIPAGLLLFLAALRNNDFTNWLGKENVQWLEDEGHGALVARAAGELASMSRQFTEALPQHWQAMFFPVAVGGELQQARLFVKRDKKQQSGLLAGKKNDDTRFVIEVDLTQLGEIQMDGFVRRDSQEVHFDLMIRSLTPLSANVQRDILQIYSDTGELTGYKGNLIFQTVKEFPVNPMEEIAAQGKTVMA